MAGTGEVHVKRNGWHRKMVIRAGPGFVNSWRKADWRGLKCFHFRQLENNQIPLHMSFSRISTSRIRFYWRRIQNNAQDEVLSLEPT